MPNDTTVIEINNVCFSYNKREILHNVNIAIPNGSMTAIVGPNGGGKTTLLLLILGMFQPERGTVRLLNEAPSSSRHRVGYVPQKMEFDKNFPVTAIDVVRMGFLSKTHRSVRGKYFRSNALQALALTRSEHLANHPFAQLSGGEKQRVLIARALAPKPELLLLDEPTANVDPRSEHELYELFKDLNQRIPIVFVSHNLNVVSRNVSHVICVNHTAAIHPIGDVLENTFTELYGGKLAIIHHGDSCDVYDPSHALSKPHGAGNEHNHHH